MGDSSVPAPKETPEGSVYWYDDPKIKAVLQTVLAPIVVGTVLRWLKIKEDPEMVNDLSAWMVSTILPAVIGLALALRAIVRRVKAGKDPNNPAKPIAGPALIGKLLGG